MHFVSHGEHCATIRRPTGERCTGKQQVFIMTIITENINTKCGQDAEILVLKLVLYKVIILEVHIITANL